MDEAAAESLAAHHGRVARGDTPMDSLSNREIQVLKRIAMGLSNREIAENYNLSIKTVDTYRYRLLRKLNLKNNAELTRFAMRNGIVD